MRSLSSLCNERGVASVYRTSPGSDGELTKQVRHAATRVPPAYVQHAGAQTTVGRRPDCQLAISHLNMNNSPRYKHRLGKSGRAAKYGALSLPTSGCVTISWNEALDAGGARHLSLLWQESGGPEVKAPRRSGFGSKLIKQAAGGAKGSVDLRFPPDGVVCVLILALIDEGAHLLLGPGGGLESNSE